MATKWIWVIEVDMITRKNPEGDGRWVRADRIDSVCPYDDGTCTIGVGGSYLHINSTADKIMDEIDMRGGNTSLPAPPVGYM